MFGPPRAAYLHVPFCRHRCGYCNFTVVAGRDDLQTTFLQALTTELQRLEVPRPVDTIYIGGGTPTQLTAENLQLLCQLIRSWFPTGPHFEWSIEANPYDLTPEKVRLLRAGGVNRVSLGIQSFDSAKLAVLQRDHRLPEIMAAYQLCRDHFPSVSLDLIFAVPGESLAQWQEDLARAIELRPDHISVYGLTFDKGALFWGALARGDLVRVGDESERAMYELAIDQLTLHGWQHYEVSNFAQPGHRCRHNEVYWVGDSYFAAGPGAARYVDGRREMNHRSTTTYIRRVLSGQSPVAESESLAPEDRAREQLVFQLRMLEGVARGPFAARTGFDIDQLVADPLRKFIDLGLLEDTGSHVRLTRNGLLISDALWTEFL